MLDEVVRLLKELGKWDEIWQEEDETSTNSTINWGVAEISHTKQKPDKKYQLVTDTMLEEARSKEGLSERLRVIVHNWDPFA